MVGVSVYLVRAARVRARSVLSVATIVAAVMIEATGCSGPPDLAAAPPPVAIEIDEASTAQRLAAAVRIETVSSGDERPADGKAFLALHHHLAVSYPKLNATLKHETIGDYSLLYTWSGSDASLAPMLLMAHLDVVPVEPGTEGAWDHLAFSGDIADGLIWGRGTLDNKVMVLGALEAVEHLLGEGVVPKRTVYLAFGHDEEVFGEEGARRIAETLAARGVHLDYVLDEGGLIAREDVSGAARPAALIGIAEKGYLSIELKVHGAGGHSSTPPQETAIGLLARAIDRLQRNPLPAELREPVSLMLDYLASDLPFFERMAVRNRWLLGPVLISRLSETPSSDALIRTTTAPTVFVGGIKDNVLPREAHAIVNFRILPGDTIETTLDHARSVIDDPRVSFQVLGGASEPSRISDEKAAGFAALRKAVQEVFPGIAVAPSLVIAQSDSRHYAAIATNIYRFLPVPFRASDIPRFHGVNERIAVSDYANVVRFYMQVLRNSAL